MKAIQISLVHGRLDREKDDKKQVEIRVYFPATRRRVYKATGVWVKHFADGKVSSREPNYSSQARILDSQIANIKSVYDDFVLKKKDFTPADLKKYFSGEDARVTFNTFFEETLRRSQIRYSTYQNKSVTLKILNAYNPEINFAELDYEFVINFNKHLSEMGFLPGTIGKIHSHLKSIINEAIKMDYMVKSPYLKFKLKRHKVRKFALTESQIMAIYALPSSEILDMFLLSCCTGLRLSDVSSLKPESFRELNGEMYVVVDEMKKIEGRGVVNKAGAVFPIGEQLARKYAAMDSFNFSTHKNINVGLRKKLTPLNLNKKITFHISRHTFLTHVAIQSGSIFAVMKAGGISNVSTAQGYVDMANSLIGNF